MLYTWQITAIDADEYLSELGEHSVEIPLEQGIRWAQYETCLDGRTHLGYYRATKNNVPCVYFSAISFEWAGRAFAWLRSGPIWVQQPNEDEERSFIRELVRYAKTKWKNIIHLRIGTRFDHDNALPAHTYEPHEHTIIIDIPELNVGNKNDQELRASPLTSLNPEELNRLREHVIDSFTRRGRRDVRKALREAPITVTEETTQAAADFSEYYTAMLDTAQRDHFVPWDSDFYQNLLNAFGVEHSRLFVGRTADGKVSNWMLVLFDGHKAQYRYGASSTGTMRNLVNERTMVDALVVLGLQGVRHLDLFGIGSERAPSLLGLNKYKRKYNDSITTIPWDADFYVRPLYHRTALTLRKVMKKILRK